MRGRTLGDAFVILDEAQNATHEQLKMFLTRLGQNSKMVVTGDDTQIDLPRGMRSGILDVERLFEDVDDVAIVRLDENDVVRHPLVEPYRRGVRPPVARTRRLMVACALRPQRGSSMVYLNNQTRGTGLDTRALVRVLERLLAAIGEDGTSVSLTFVRDPAMRELNREHRSKDVPTDVLSFPLHRARNVRPQRADAPLKSGDVHGVPDALGETEDAAPERMLGDIVVSLDTALRQAAAYDAPLEREVQRLLVHAVLHLAGHDHMEPGERAVDGGGGTALGGRDRNAVALSRSEHTMIRPLLAVALAAALLAAAPKTVAQQTAPPQPPTVQEARAHWAVQGADDETQRLVDRGLMMLYAFDVGEARVAFGKALEKNPDTALAYWGEAEADTIDINQPQTDAGDKRGGAAVGEARKHMRARERGRAHAGRRDRQALRPRRPQRALRALRRCAERVDEDAPRRPERARRRRVSRSGTPKTRCSTATTR